MANKGYLITINNMITSVNGTYRHKKILGINDNLVVLIPPTACIIHVC